MNYNQEKQITCFMREADTPDSPDQCCCVRNDHSENEAFCYEVVKDCCSNE
jgi:hypothetical protein